VPALGEPKYRTGKKKSINLKINQIKYETTPPLWRKASSEGVSGKIKNLCTLVGSIESAVASSFPTLIYTCMFRNPR